MRQYEGAVLFLDILGVGDLTRGKVELTDADYRAWGIKTNPGRGAQYFCAKILLNFRSALRKLARDQPKLNIAQLSDCVFIWSSAPTDVIRAARLLMWNFAREGVFCRGGISYGEIVEPDKVSASIGKFVLGSAVTTAAGLERTGKGSRIFSDTSLPSKLQKISHAGAFRPIRNPIDCSVADEFQWFAFPDGEQLIGEEEYDVRQAAISALDLVYRWRLHPRYRWNAASSAGKQQLAATIETVSTLATEMIKPFGGADYCFRAEHVWDSLESGRSEEAYRRQFIRCKSEILQLPSRRLATALGGT